ncbi:MAG: ABC transporter ATP-binding protein [Ignavibacteria bacterium]|nr:ABC transporter ATP-binding protein [Ignavibacteria bacterium]MBP6509009.1 ABC transporter ATP-binding protein [Candidatus Kapabacteria bacterium]MBK6420056.1 ABC transporter ATP-binding protein [Ignavibacteria bacterium]MBK6759312.1 ABC transporter ATP-binding protein [Ignavibacteria bacterium]MBK7185040.1 ABC transporter ATP-binding protein [Ignavibacteria bacterium]
MAPLLEVRNLVTEFRSDIYDVKAVNDVSFTVHKGRTLGIVGESGSGKSVTSLSVMRLIQTPPGRITGGKALFHEDDGLVTDLLTISEEKMRTYRGNKIAMIFQEPMTSLNPVFTCGDQIIEAIRLHQNVSKDVARERTLQLLKEVKLPRPESMMTSYPHQLSGGQKQRVMIAMAMSCNPSLLIADEPTTALDVTVQATILDLMRNLQRQHGMSMMFITHDLGVIAEIADDVIVMYKGKIVETGTVQEIFENPQHPYTKGLLACRPRLDKKLKILPTVRDFMDESETGEITLRSQESVDQLVHELEFSREEIAARNAALATEKPLLDVKDLQVYFPIKSGIFGRTSGHVKAVDGITFNVKPGETLGLVGESGCGKTTTGRAILRLVEPTGGSVMFDGKDVRALASTDLKSMRKDFQIIFQDPYSSLNPRLSVGSAIMEVLSVHNIGANDAERKEHVLYLLDKVNLLPRHFSNYPHEFSGGQRQRICIARALALKPKLLICDESVSALDVSVQAQVLNLLVDLRDEFKLTYIFISHDLSVVKFISDRIAVMNAGKIVEMDTSNELYDAPKDDYTRKLINAIPTGTLDAIRARTKERPIA